MTRFCDMLQNVALKHHYQIKKATEPLLKNLNLNHFWYNYTTNEGYFSSVDSHTGWCEFWASTTLYLKYPFFRHPKWFQEGVYLLHKDSQDQSLKEVIEIGREHYDFALTFQIVNKTKNGVEQFGFSSQSDTPDQIAAFFNELPLIRLFCRKFCEENRNLIELLKENQINLHQLIGPSFHQNDVPFIPGAIDKHSLIQRLNGKFTFSQKDREIIKLTLQGYSAGKIAPQVFLSRRTVEHHIERIKDKLNCDTKAELIQKATELEKHGCLQAI